MYGMSGVASRTMVYIVSVILICHAYIYIYIYIYNIYIYIYIYICHRLKIWVMENTTWFMCSRRE